MKNFLIALVIELSAMIYCNHGRKRDILIGNFRSYHVRNHVFGTQIIEISGITCQNEEPITLF